MYKFTTIGVIDMGYVGIPSAMIFANHSSIEHVIGFTSDKSKADMLNDGKNPLETKEPLLEEEIRYAKKYNKFRCNTSLEELRKCDAIIICTPVSITSKDGSIAPDYTSLDDSLRGVMQYIDVSKKPPVIIESTLPPKTTESHVLKMLETTMRLDNDFYLAYAPSRIAPGHSIYNLINIDRCIGGVSNESTKCALALYGTISRKGKNIKMTSLEAEITRVAENAIRDVQIATANQIALYCETLGANFTKVKEGVDSLRGDITRALLNPGSGVGGISVPVDGYLFEHSVDSTLCHENTKLPFWIPSLFIVARKINDYMPWHVMNIIENYGKEIKRVLILGYASVRNTSVIENSPSEKLLYLFKNIHPEIDVNVFDPYVESYNRKEGYGKFDAVIVMMDHDDFREIKSKELSEIAKVNSLFIDTKNMFDPMDVICAGLVYRGIGRGDLI